MTSADDKIAAECQSFLNSGAQSPLFKLLPESGPTFYKVKIRHKRPDELGEAFSKAFDEHKLRERSVFTHSKLPLSLSPELVPYCVFPIDGFKYLYCLNVLNSHHDYRQVLVRLREQVGDSALAVTADLIKLNYHSEGLSTGIKHGAEIVLYNIPYYYALRVCEETLPTIKKLYPKWT